MYRNTSDENVWKNTQQMFAGPTKYKAACQVLWDAPVSGLGPVLRELTFR